MSKRTLQIDEDIDFPGHVYLWRGDELVALTPKAFNTLLAVIINWDNAR